MSSKCPDPTTKKIFFARPEAVFVGLRSLDEA
jgi:hypothetical protein